MFAASSASGRGKPSRSSSAILADIARGYHDLKIDACSLAVPTVGELLLSCPFTVGGRRWRLMYYPNGDREETAGHVSLYLRLDEDAAAIRPATVQYQFIILKEQRASSFLRNQEKKLHTIPVTTSRFNAAHRAWGWSTFAKKEALTQQLRLLKANRFTIRCEIVVHNGFRAVQEQAAPPKAASNTVPPPDLQRHLGDLLRTGRGADVVFEVGSETFAAHRCVLAARSPVFSAELFGAMVESGAAAVVRVEEMEAPVFQALLCFVYTDSLPVTNKEDEDVMYQHLLVAADRYDLQRLKLICEDKLSKRIGVSTVEIILALAEQHHCDGLKKACLDFLRGPENQLRAVVATHSQ
ncbi:hypothetical protein PR202_ga00299 [Eleusine coracana subsp. coracana]|uniref:Uncharacterized protein n=1 Tax=Eleusine coracana subsp. coracana TaxID=191504 RepID=A0AAV5BBX8_ELECO|nr:hypothetical protein QOZ80_2AG0125270 [Eleusine coracana subsp. coracana]GJM84614.1 hypothetical protein PR202_ga00299 [Eleusine coracana subsp. coracana]